MVVDGAWTLLKKEKQIVDASGRRGKGGSDESGVCSHARSAISPLMKNQDFIVHILQSNHP
jgi:hypothetical protein